MAIGLLCEPACDAAAQRYLLCQLKRSVGKQQNLLGQLDAWGGDACARLTLEHLAGQPMAI
jgi:hypothetical protein